MNLWVVAFLCAIVVVGHLCTFALPVAYRVEERLAYGTVLGTIVVSTVGFFFAWAFGMSRGSVVAAAAVSLVLGLLVAAPHRRAFAAELATVWPRLRLGVRDRDSLLPVAGLVACSAVVSGRIMAFAYGRTAEGGMSVGHLSTYGDWSAHLAYAGSFAWGDNFPPELPTAVGEPFAYHFGVDFFAAMFVPLGTTLQGALELSTWILATAFPAVMYLASLRFVERRLAAALGTLVFLASGGTAAISRFLYDDLIDGGPGVLFHLPRTYAFDGFERNWVDNAVTGFLYPQRPTLIGFPIVLIVLATLWAWRRGRDAVPEPADDGFRLALVLGVLVGIMPVFHVFAFGVLVVLAGFWAVLDVSGVLPAERPWAAPATRLRAWAAFVLPALVLGLPLVVWQWPEESGYDGHAWWILGRVIGDRVVWPTSVSGFLGFWFLNTGFFIPLALGGMWMLRDRIGVRFLPIVGLLVIPNIATFHFWEGNNVKYVIFFLLLGAPFVGHVLDRLVRAGPGYAALAGVLLVTLTLSGGLDIWRAFEATTGAEPGAASYPAGYLDAADVLVGTWIRDNTPGDAVFATAAGYTHPVRSIAARRVVAGAPGRLRDLGVDYQPRLDRLQLVYGVNEGYDRVIDEYAIDYVVIGPQERREFRPADAPTDWNPAVFYDAVATKVYDVGGYQVYDVRGLRS